MNKNNFEVIHILYCVAVIYITLSFSKQPDSLSDTCFAYEVDFAYQEKAYVLDTRLKNNADAEAACKASYNGHLPVIKSQSMFDGINNGLMSIHSKKTREVELWVGGRTSVKEHQTINFNGSIIGELHVVCKCLDN